MDEAVPYEAASGMISYTFREMREWANEIGETSISVSFYDLRKNMERERKPEKVVPIMHEFVGRKLEMPSGFLRSQYFTNLVQVYRRFL